MRGVMRTILVILGVHRFLPASAARRTNPAASACLSALTAGYGSRVPLTFVTERAKRHPWKP